MFLDPAWKFFFPLRVQVVQSLRSVQSVQFPDESEVRSNVLDGWNDLNGLNGCYLPIAGTCGACVVCREFSGSSPGGSGKWDLLVLGRIEPFATVMTNSFRLALNYSRIQNVASTRCRPWFSAYASSR